MIKSRINIYDDRSKKIVRNRLDKLPEDGTVYVEFGRIKNNRSLAQNRLLWQWCGEFGEYAGYTRQQAHDVFCREILGVDLVNDLHGVEREIVPGTRGLSVRQMVDFLTQMEAICTEMGFMLTIPEDYGHIMGEK